MRSILAFVLLSGAALCQTVVNPPAGGGGGSPAGPTGAVQYKVNSTTLGGFGIWSSVDKTLTLYDGADGTSGNNIFAISGNVTDGDPFCGALFSLNCSGAVPTTVAIAGASNGAPIYMATVGGGDTSITTTGVGGGGGVLELVPSSGGAAPLAATNSTGGFGGFLDLNTGVGGDATSVSNTGINHGGHGGGFDVFMGRGGNAANGTSNTGGDGGNINFRNSSGGTGDTADGRDGTFTVVGGARGNNDIFVWIPFGGGESKIDSAGRFNNLSTAFAALGTPGNGAQQYCSDCAATSAIDNTCAASGSGAMAFRINGAWKCIQ